MFRYPLILVYFAVFSVIFFSAVFGADRVRLLEIQTLTFQEGKRTTGRRSSPIPQLKCIGGSAGLKGSQPKVVQCYNRGSDGRDVQWECKAETEKSVKLGRVEVACEGYDYPDDPYILVGSCGLEYELDWTEKSHHQSESYGWKSNDHHDAKKSSGFGVNFFTLIIIALIIYITYRWCFSGSNSGPTPAGFPHPPPTAPPPYDDQPPPYGWNFGTGNSGQNNDGSDSYRKRNTGPSATAGPSGNSWASGTAGPRVQQQTQSPFGGFWTGLGTGSLLGYLFGRQGQSTRHGMPPNPSSGNNWFTDSNWNGRTADGAGAGSSSSNWFSGSSSPSGSSGSSNTHTSTSYGGTKRR